MFHNVLEHVPDPTDRFLLERARSRAVHDLSERVKELTALQHVAAVLQSVPLATEDVLQAVASLLPHAFQRPEAAAARVRLDRLTRTTTGFAETGLKQSASFLTAGGQEGEVDVVYVCNPQLGDGAVFLPEEQSLLDTIAEMLRTHFERREVESALRESRERMQHLLTASPAVIYTAALTPPYPITYLSENVEAQFGYAVSDFLSDAGFRARHTHPDDLHVIEDARARLLADETSVAEYRFRCKDGTYRWTQTRAKLVRDESGAPAEMIGYWIDITDRKRAEQALSDSERHFRRLIENATDLVITVDSTGTITYESPAAHRILGHPPDALIGTNAFALVHPEDLERIRSVFLEGVLGLEPRTAEYRYRCADGTYRWLESCGRPLLDDGGAVVGGIINSRDVTERREVADALVRSNSIRKAIEDAVMAGLIVFDASGRIAYVNRAFCRMTDFYEEELLGRMPPFPYWSPEDVEVRRARFERLLAGDAVNHEGRFLKRNGERFDVLVQPSPIDLPDGTRGWIAVVNDITERKRLENEYRQAQKMEAIGRLAGGVAHDFNNLLTAILGYAELSIDEVPAGTALRENLVEIRKAGESAASLTKHLLAFSRHQVLQPTVLSLNTVVREMTKILGRVIGEDVKLLTALAPDLCSTRADRGQIEQVIMNLAVNARDAMPAGGHLVVQTGNRKLDDTAAAGCPEVAPGEYVALSVSDTGHGMDGEVLSHLFEPFFTTKERGRGTGLGLATIYGIVKQSGGYILVNSLAGRGTSFIVLLPACYDLAEQLPADGRVSGHRAAAERILVVEDNDAIRSLAEQVLTQAGYDVHVAGTSEDAIAMLTMAPFAIDLLLTDVVMPGMSGAALAEALRRRFPRLPCVFMSGYTDDALKHHGVQGIEDTFLPKPFRPAALLQKVRERLDQPAGA